MATIEIVLLIVAYTLIVVTIFLEIICYRRNLETFETIAFTFSLLLLIIAFTVSSFLENSKLENSINIFTLIAMILVGLTTPLNVLEERQHNVNPIWKKVLFTLSILLVVIVVLGFFTNTLEYLQYAVILFLSGSVILSMLLVRLIKPQKRIAHRERI